MPQPGWTVNVALSYQGLKEREVPSESLMGFSPEFVAGMKARKDILGDDGPSSPEFWDPLESVEVVSVSASAGPTSGLLCSSHRAARKQVKCGALLL